MKKQLIKKRKVIVPEKSIEEMFNRQISFQSKFFNIKEVIEDSKKLGLLSQGYIDSMLTNIIQEACEAREWTHFKHWKKYPEKWSKEERWEFLNELIDIQHFLINAAIGVGCNSKEYTYMFFNKQKENQLRQKKGY